MIVEIRNNSGMRLGAVRFVEVDEYGDEFVIQNINNSNNIRISDGFDDIFDTNDRKLQIQIEDSKLFNTSNYYNVGDVPAECRDLVKELNSYSVALKWFHRENYNDCYIIIENYFGHIDYGKEFGYFKTHEEICQILLRNLTYSLSKNGNPESFEDFCNRMMQKIIWNLKHEHNYEVNEKELIKRCY